MVDDIHFHKPLPPITNTNRVTRTGRQDKQKQDRSFKKYLKQKQDSEEENKEDQKQKKQTKEMNPPEEIFEKNAEAAPPVDKPDASRKPSGSKRIDVRA